MRYSKGAPFFVAALFLCIGMLVAWRCTWPTVAAAGEAVVEPT